MVLSPEDALKILLAILLGGLIGAEREFRHKAAGFRTIIFICLGATLFTMLSLKLGGDTSPVRIAAHLVTGVGFLCAGVVMEQGAQIVGLTTASTIWLAAALGMGIGGGYYLLSLIGVVAIIGVLLAFPRFEERIYRAREQRTYEIVCGIDLEKRTQLEEMSRECDLLVKDQKLAKSGAEMICTLEAYGAPSNHEQFVQKLFADNEVKRFQF
jgi:putative Mg2+ transporter-C (MgtC) family protein